MLIATSGELLFEIAPSKSIDVQFIRGVDKFVKVGVEMLLAKCVYNILASKYKYTAILNTSALTPPPSLVYTPVCYLRNILMMKR